MSCDRFCFHTDAAAIAMPVIGRAAHAADPALVAMKLPLVFIVQEHTGGAPIVAQCFFT